MQVMVGTFLVPRLQTFIRNETARLAGTEADEFDDDDEDFDEEYGEETEKMPAEDQQEPVREAEGSSCIALPWASAALDGAPDSDFTDGEGVDVYLTELENVSVASSGPRAACEEEKLENDTK